METLYQTDNYARDRRQIVGTTATVYNFSKSILNSRLLLGSKSRLSIENKLLFQGNP